MSRIPEASIVVARPIDAVFRFVADPANDPRWHTTVIAVQQRSPGPLGVGSTFTGAYDSNRRDLRTPPRPETAQALEARLVAFDPPRRSRLRVRFAERPRGVGGRLLGQTFDLTFLFAPVPGGTLVQRGGDMHPTGLLRLLVPLLVRLNARRSDYLLKLLKQAAEAAIPD